MNDITRASVGICQLTTGHSLDDERILHRMAWTAHHMGLRSQVAGPGQDSSEFEGISLSAVYDPSSRTWFTGRMFAWIRMVLWALRSSFRVFQIHDPDMLPAGLVLRTFGRKVVYDVHDDYQASFETKFASIPVLRSIIPKSWWLFEKNAARFFNGVIVADRHLAKKFAKCDPLILGNYPGLNFTDISNTSGELTFNILYVGGVTLARGLGVVLEALKQLPHVDLRLHVVGNCRDASLKKSLAAESRVILHGQVDWTKLRSHYEHAHLGLAVYQPLPGFVTVDHSVKIVEYMAAGIPIITSNFPGLTAFVKDGGFGEVIDPTDPKALADQIEELFLDRDKCARLGSRGRELFESDYNWENHEHKLEQLYHRVC